MKSVIFTAFFALFCSVAAAQKAPSKAEVTKFVNASKAAFQAQLKDPDSAKYRNLFIGLPRDFGGNNTREIALCGEVNARNSYGGLTGFKRFYFASGAGESESEPDQSFDAMFFMHCTDKGPSL